MGVFVRVGKGGREIVLVRTGKRNRTLQERNQLTSILSQARQRGSNRQPMYGTEPMKRGEEGRRKEEKNNSHKAARRPKKEVRRIRKRPTQKLLGEMPQCPA